MYQVSAFKGVYAMNEVDLYDYDCEQSCSMLRACRNKLEAINKFLEELKDYQYGVIQEMVIPRLAELLKDRPSGGTSS